MPKSWLSRGFLLYTVPAKRDSCRHQTILLFLCGFQKRRRNQQVFNCEICCFLFITLFDLARLIGHQQLVNDVRFSPDTRILASASFDKSIRLWDGRTGKYVCTCRLSFFVFKHVYVQIYHNSKRTRAVCVYGSLVCRFSIAR
jgi:WD40 repeat protein